MKKTILILFTVMIIFSLTACVFKQETQQSGSGGESILQKLDVGGVFQNKKNDIEAWEADMNGIQREMRNRNLDAGDLMFSAGISQSTAENIKSISRKSTVDAAEIYKLYLYLKVPVDELLNQNY